MSGFFTFWDVLTSNDYCYNRLRSDKFLRAKMNMRKFKLLVWLLLSGMTLAAAQDCKLDAISGPHSTVVVYRYRLFVGSGRRASVYLDDKQVCSLHNGRYLIIDIPAGKHKLRSSDDQHGGVEQEFQSDQVSFYRIHVEATSAFQVKDFWVLDSVPEPRARQELLKLHPQDGETKPIPAPKEKVQQSQK